MRVLRALAPFLGVRCVALVKLSASAVGALSALTRRQLRQPPAPVPLDSARLPMALQAVRARARPRAESQHLADSVHLADGGYGVQGKYR